MNSLFHIQKKLQSAISNHDLTATQVILDRENWVVNRLVQEHYSFLYLAAENGFVDAAKLLIQANANVNQQCDRGKTPLIIASANGHVEIVQLLLAQPKTIVALCDDLHQTPLHYATANNHPNIRKLLLEAKANISNDDEQTKLLKTAVEGNAVETAQSYLQQEQWLVNRLVWVKNMYGHTSYSCLLGKAAELGLVDMGRLLIQHGADINQQSSKGSTPLITATCCFQRDFVRLLLAQQDIAVDVLDNERRSALFWAASNGSDEILEALVNAKACLDHVDDTGATALLAAADHGHTAALQVLLQCKANVDHQDEYDCSSLHKAALRGRNDAVESLLEANATVDLTDLDGFTPLLMAADNGNLRGVQLLLASSASVSHCAMQGGTALHRAAIRGHDDIVAELLGSGAPVDTPNVRGWTPLMYAATCGKDSCLLVLLAAKANIDTADVRGNTSLNAAIRNNRVTTTRILMDRGANWLRKRRQSPRQNARGKNPAIQSLFHCAVCGWSGRCCPQCRKKYCALECDKVGAAATSGAPVDCKLHRKVAHYAVLEWTLAVAALELPPYVVEHIFTALRLNCTDVDYQQRTGTDFLWNPLSGSSKISQSYFHLIVEERTHLQNIQLFIAVHKAFANRLANKMI